MICRTCGNNSSRVMVLDGSDQCSHCGNFGEAGGTNLHSILTRNSTRIRQQQKAYEQDFTPPHIYDKAKKKIIPNKAFIQNFPAQAKKTFTTDEMKSIGITKLKGKS